MLEKLPRALPFKRHKVKDFDPDLSYQAFNNETIKLSLTLQITRHGDFSASPRLSQ